MDKLNVKRVLVATLIELAVRTKAKIQIEGTKRGGGNLTPEMYQQTSVDVKNELSVRGMLDV